MTANQSLLDFFIHAGPVVKGVMLILLIASLIAWTFIFQKWMHLAYCKRKLKQFEKTFWSGIEMSAFEKELKAQKSQEGVASIFLAGFAEFNAMKGKVKTSHQEVLSAVRRAMMAEQNRITDVLESRLSFLATVGSTSPYIGLFGTVWGIMTAFSALGHVQQATIAMVAPGISEALIATAMGLFAAIPAVIGYNRFTARVDYLLSRYDSFQEDFLCVLNHKLVD